MSAALGPWEQHALETLRRRGYRSGAARQRVIEALASRGCCATAHDLADDLNRGGSRVGIASVYRTLEQLDRLALVHRLDVGDGTARYEPAPADGAHHHHAICNDCGRVAPFEDDALERAIHLLADRLEYSIDAHDVVLRGLCPACRAGEESPATAG